MGRDRVSDDDELVCLRVAIGAKLLQHLRRHGGRIEARLGGVDWQQASFQPREDEPRVLEQAVHRLQRKEAQVVLVEQADGLIRKVTAEQREPHTAVRDIRNRRDNVTARAQERLQGAQQPLRILQVLQHIGGDDHIEAVVAQLAHEVKLLQVADNHTLTVEARALSSIGVHLDPDYLAAAMLQHSAHVPGGAPQLQYALLPANQAHDESVGAVRVNVNGHFVPQRLAPLAWARAVDRHALTPSYG